MSISSCPFLSLAQGRLQAPAQKGLFEVFFSDCFWVWTTSIRKVRMSLKFFSAKFGFTPVFQISIFTGKPCTLRVRNGSFSAFWHYKNHERLLKALEVKSHIPSPCLDASKTVFYWNLLHKKGIPSGYD